jgi:hypothetical protein
MQKFPAPRHSHFGVSTWAGEDEGKEKKKRKRKKKELTGFVVFLFFFFLFFPFFFLHAPPPLGKGEWFLHWNKIFQVLGNEKRWGAGGGILGFQLLCYTGF